VVAGRIAFSLVMMKNEPKCATKLLSAFLHHYMCRAEKSR